MGAPSSLGIDLATTNGATGVCEVDWRSRTSVVSVGQPSNDELRRRIQTVSTTGGWTAIDAPFGFPAAFSRAVGEWRHEGRVTTASDADIIRRVTDRHVQARQAALPIEVRGRRPMWPLSSVVERITPTTVRTMQLLSSLADGGVVDRIGSETKVVEAYPIAALRLWGVSTADYKTNAKDADLILEHVCEQTGITMPVGYTSLRPALKHDAVDALVCALVARVAEVDGRTGPDPITCGSDMVTIREEGWIHLPPEGHSLQELR